MKSIRFCLILFFALSLPTSLACEKAAPADVTVVTPGAPSLEVAPVVEAPAVIEEPAPAIEETAPAVEETAPVVEEALPTEAAPAVVEEEEAPADTEAP